MWTTALLATIWMALAIHLGTAYVADFKHNVMGVDLIYHSQTHLLLAIQGVRCYYVSVPTNHENYLQGTGAQSNHFSLLGRDPEIQLVNFINNNITGAVRVSSLQEVRDTFQDLLANYHCLDKQIFEVDFFNMGTDSHHGDRSSSDTFCDGKASGWYVDPRTCHSYYECTGIPGTNKHRTCDSGQGFSQLLHKCLNALLVTDCYHQSSHNSHNNDKDQDSDDYHGDPESDTFCQGKRKGQYPDSKDCHSYYDCTGVSGTNMHRTCSMGKGFSPTFHKCISSAYVINCYSHDDDDDDDDDDDHLKDNHHFSKYDDDSDDDD